MAHIRFESNVCRSVELCQQYFASFLMPLAALGHTTTATLGDDWVKFMRARELALISSSEQETLQICKHSIQMEQYLFAVFVCIGIASQPRRLSCRTFMESVPIPFGRTHCLTSWHLQLGTWPYVCLCVCTIQSCTMFAHPRHLAFIGEYAMRTALLCAVRCAHSMVPDMCTQLQIGPLRRPKHEIDNE